MKTLPRARKRRPLPEPPMTAPCLCGHDYGSHDGKRCTVRLGAELTCACLGFKLATPAAREADNQKGPPRGSAGWRDAGDRFIAERARSIKGTPAPAGEATKGDSLLLLRIAVALERIAHVLEQDSLMVKFGAALGVPAEKAIAILQQKLAKDGGR
jgi:hypothetical protein